MFPHAHWTDLCAFITTSRGWCVQIVIPSVQEATMCFFSGEWSCSATWTVDNFGSFWFVMSPFVKRALKLSTYKYRVTLPLEERRWSHQTNQSWFDDFKFGFTSCGWKVPLFIVFFFLRKHDKFDKQHISNLVAIGTSASDKIPRVLS